jgi:hypothetical protein
MNKIENFRLAIASLKQGVENYGKRCGLAGLVALTLVGLVEAQDYGRPQRQQPVEATVFQAAGPNAEAIQSVITEYRNALGANNGIGAGKDAGRREINWDGGGSTATVITPALTDNFAGLRGARFTTNGSGFVQAPVDGLATTFGNPSYATVFKAFSAARLFSPIGSNVTDTVFFVPSGDANVIGAQATTRGFGVVLSDVDAPDGSRQGNRHASTLIEYYGVRGELLFSSFAPASPGNATFSFFGIVLADARIARVRITAGATPGADDTSRVDVVMLDDFIYGEPQAINNY